MTRTDTTNTEEMKRYLFFEASDAERETLEERFFDDNNLFYELMDLENDLVDGYAENKLDAGDRRRFERSLPLAPDRRAKVANAVALQTLIKEEKQTATIITEDKPTFWQSVSAFFGLNASSFQYATAALLLFLMVGTGFLIFERWRIGQELARLRDGENGRIAEMQRQEQVLQEQIKIIQEREQNLQTQLGSERGQTDILNDQLERELAEKTKLERELESLRREKRNLPVQPKDIQPPAPQIATIFLSPLTGGKGGGDVKTIKVNQNTAKISVTLQIPKETTAETFSVRLNDAPLAANLKPRTTKSGGKFINLSLTPKNLSPDRDNFLTVTGNDASRYNYVFRLQK